MKDFLVPFFTILVLTCLSFYAGRKTAETRQIETVTERVDTLVIRDTLTVLQPKYITRRTVDSVLVPVKETVLERDTVFVLLEREQLTWEDSLSRVYVSGIRPQVDSVTHFRDRMYITREMVIKTHSRWGVGIQGGVGVGKGGLTPYVGVGVSYNLITF